ncbi:Permease of the drug/metabolite transporter (DMT) superfamily [Pricia antarctica]|uniref:Permease of the drug/metabolite transporter (DMT) superfamily n=1 Tax=Pricia antarctica TaxID=641691 RepID=A0A1G6WMQ6_9FLAO|nr:DMT family transporter [Pricia antarctica]SDD66497.1 Permease of the drug/metabolite transporter (DMT) superfamily [Pricia antarctica]
MSKRTLAILAAIGATTIYGLNHTIAKGAMPEYVQPFGFIMFRVIGAALLFWMLSPFGPKEKIDRKDYGRMLLCAFLGMGINMLAFFKGLSLSTPINSSVLVTTTPIIVLILSAIFIKEKIGAKKIFGIAIGLTGAVALIFFGPSLREDAPNIPLGNFLVLMNSVFYGSYLIGAKTLIVKYHPFTFMKWLFTLGIFICLPFGYRDFVQVDFVNLPFEAVWRIGFVILGTTFCTYLFNIFALTQLKASTVSAFVYIQPLIGILFAVAMGKDSLSILKISAACLVLLGVYLASSKSSSPKAKNARPSHKN